MDYIVFTPYEGKEKYMEKSINKYFLADFAIVQITFLVFLLSIPSKGKGIKFLLLYLFRGIICSAGEKGRRGKQRNRKHTMSDQSFFY